jgi:hypothetical protein
MCCGLCLAEGGAADDTNTWIDVSGTGRVQGLPLCVPSTMIRANAISFPSWVNA